MSEPIVDEGLWDRVRDNEKHYARLLDVNQQHFARQFDAILSSPELPYSTFSSLFDLDGWNSKNKETGVELTELFKNGLSIDASMRLHGKVRNVPPTSNMFFDFEYSDSVARARIMESLGIGRMCPNARGANGPDGAEGIPSVRHVVIVNPSVKLPDWSKEILKFQSDDVEVTEVQGTAIPQSEHDLHMHMIGSMFQTFAPEIRDAAKLIGNEEAIDVVLDSLGGSPYMENLDPLTPEQIAIHNPPVKPAYRIPSHPEPKPRKEVSKRKSVAKAARKRTQAGRKKNRG